MEQVVVVEEPKEETPGKFDTEGLTSGEIKMAKEHGLITEEKEDAEHEKQSESKTKEDSGESKEGEAGEKEEEVKPSFQEMYDNPATEKKAKANFNDNERGLYKEFKKDKWKRQQAQKETEELRSELELRKVKDKAAQHTIAKIRESLGTEDLTIDALQEIVGVEPVKTEDDVKNEVERELRKEDDARIEKDARIKRAEEVGRDTHEDFDQLIEFAGEVARDNKLYQEIINKTFTDPSLDEESIVDRVVAIAKLHPNFGTAPKEKEEPKKEDKKVAKAIENSKKKVSSASVGGGGGKREIAFADLTIDDFARLSEKRQTEVWSKLPRNKQEELLGKPT